MDVLLLKELGLIHQHAMDGLQTPNTLLGSKHVVGQTTILYFMLKYQNQNLFIGFEIFAQWIQHAPQLFPF